MKTLAIKLIGGIALAVFVSALLFWVYRKYFDPNNKTEVIGYLLAAVPIIVDLWKIVPGAIKDYRESLIEANGLLFKQTG